MGKSYNKGLLYVVRPLTIRGNPLLYSKGFPYTFCLEISRRGFPPIVRDFLLWLGISLDYVLIGKGVISIKDFLDYVPY